MSTFQYVHGPVGPNDWIPFPAVSKDDFSLGYAVLADGDLVEWFGEERFSTETDWTDDGPESYELTFRLVRHAKTGFEGWVSWFELHDGRGFRAVEN